MVSQIKLTQATQQNNLRLQHLETILLFSLLIQNTKMKYFALLIVALVVALHGHVRAESFRGSSSSLATITADQQRALKGKKEKPFGPPEEVPQGMGRGPGMRGDSGDECCSDCDYIKREITCPTACDSTKYDYTDCPNCGDAPQCFTPFS